jgi:N-acetylglutamate synthase-like GNAT family acetyltransferase
MNSSDHRVRRATLDDLHGLKALWETMRLPSADLEKRLTEFQVVVDAQGKLVGALGVQLVQQHGWLHSEAYTDFALADEVRPLLWERIQSITANHGVFRLWTQERAPFWTRHGFQAATPETLARLPEVWSSAGPGWLTLQLKDEAVLISLDKEFALFKETEARRSAQALDQARTVKTVITVIAFVVAILVLGGGLYLILTRKSPGLIPP